MVWYVPPLSPIQSAAERGHLGRNGELPDITSLRIPLRYLANLLSAGAEAPVIRSLERMMAMRACRRPMNVDGIEDTAVPAQVGQRVEPASGWYRPLPISHYQDPFALPTP